MASAFSTNQGTYQWFLAVPTRRHGQKALMLSVPVIACFYFLCCFTGLVAYSKYADCDPIEGKLIEKADQIVPYFVMDTLGTIPGLPGLFVAGIFSASLSTLSTFLSGTSLTILEDFVRPFYPNLGDETATKISKFISFGIGLFSYLLVFLISNVKTIFETGFSVSGAGLGMNMGTFTLGLINPWCNWIGALTGMIAGYVCVLALGIFTQTARSQGLLTNKQMKPTSILNCPNLMNETFQDYSQSITDPLIKNETFYLLKISFFWYALIGTLIVIIVGTLVSLLTGPQDPEKIDPKLLFPFLRRWIGRKKESQPDGNNDEVVIAVNNKGSKN